MTKNLSTVSSSTLTKVRFESSSSTFAISCTLTHSSCMFVCLPPSPLTVDDGVKEDDLHIRTRGLSLKDAPFKEPPGPRSNLIKFWDAIASIPFESHARELVLPDGVAFFNRETLGGRIFIRDCFAALFESMLPFLTDRPGVVVLTGVPGTGKSHFAAYVAWRLANMPSIKQIVYTRDPQKSDSFDLATRTITSSYTVSDERPAISNFRGCEHVHIVDILDVVPPKDFFGSTFIFSSPNRIRYKESLKHKNSIRFIMPLWTLDEIHAAREGFFPNVSKELADEIFEMYGGVPRFVLEKASTAKTAMTEALASVKSFQNILDVLQTGGAEKLDTEMSYKILHIAPKCINADSSPRVYDFLDSPVYSFASRWVAHEIFERQEDAMIMELKRCILNSRAVNELGGIRGVMFGEFAHSLLVKIDCVYNMRRLGEAADEADRLRLPHFKKLTRFDGKETPLSALSADDYIYPVSKNYPSVDAFAKVGRILYLFQMTVSDQHPVLGAPIVKIIEDFGCGVGPKMGLDEVHLIFVRPKMDSVTLFKLQSILNDDKKAYTRMPSGLAKVQQWECALDLF